MGVNHDVFRLQIAVNHAMAMDVIQCVGNSQGDLDCAVGRKHLLLVQKLA